MKTINVSEATGPALDWLVAKALGFPLDVGDFGTFIPWTRKWAPMWDARRYSPSTDWAQGGPILERERLLLRPDGLTWECSMGGDNWFKGATALIAAMRCYCISKFGNTAEVPEELL